MDVYIKPLLAARCIFEGQAEFLTPYVCQIAFGKIKALPGGNLANGGLFPMAKSLGPMARAMEYLIVQSLTEFDNCLKDIKSMGSKTLVNKSEFKEIVREVRTLRSRAGYVGHPKMEKLWSMCLDHFAPAEKDIDEATGKPRKTKVMVLCNYRAVVEEIVNCLNTQQPLIKATPFVGQAHLKGSRGMSQKDQIEVSSVLLYRCFLLSR
jgi:ERCC4-related helicase